MRDSIDDLEMDLGRLPEIRNTDAPAQTAAQQIRKALRGKHVCPFCGTQRETDVGACLHCSLEDTPTTRSATRGKLGPWYVLQSRNPSAPGMNFATLMTLVQKGKVTARSVLRGPTTGQFWRHAAKVKGVSREFALCWNCGGDIAKNARACPSCKRLQEPPLNPDVLLENGEFSGEELAEAMWADQTSESSQMAAAPAPRPASSPVDRLVARGGVRREVTAHQHEYAPGTLPGRAPRGILNDDEVENLPAHGVEMAVFQMPQRPGTPRRRRGILGRLFKILFVSVLLVGLGVGAMCTFDEGIRGKCKGFAKRTIENVKAWINGTSATPTPEAAPIMSGGGAQDGSLENNKPKKADVVPSAPQVTVGGRETVTPAERPQTSSVLTTPGAISPEQARNRVWVLWHQGEAAERDGDFAGALKSWAEIKSLGVPEDGLPLKLDAKIREMKSKVK